MSEPRLWFTSDLHFGHEFMARLRSERKLLWTEQRNSFGMDEWLIEEWRKVVEPRDRVVVIGDFSFRNRKQTEEIFDQLPGQKELARGNHDPKHTEQLGWTAVYDFKRIKWNSQSIYVFHYPMLTWPNAHHGTWHLHGHSHGNLRAPESTRLDVGPDATGQLLISVEEVAEIMEQRSYDFVDHHDAEAESRQNADGWGR